jgi:hypothetical protein
MIYQLAVRRQKLIARFFLLIFYISSIAPSYGVNENFRNNYYFSKNSYSKKIGKKIYFNTPNLNNNLLSINNLKLKTNNIKLLDIGGPSQPEMSSFKSVDANNLVNLFTGDFSYNIPLLDVGGYPINIFYDGGVTPEQEASWVGLGWNINPGAINRNMRGVPDDFDGTDILKQTQTMKPNHTFGINLGADFELAGIKNFDFSLGGSLGLDFNNYLGPALNIGIKGGINYTIAKFSMSEKGAFDTLKIKASLNGSANFSSRTGTTFGISSSLTSSFNSKSSTLSRGLGASTSYNSRYGIRSLTLYDQLSFSNQNENKKDPNKPYKHSLSATLRSTSISFLKPSYVPSMRMPITNIAGSGHIQFGSAWFFAHGSGEVEVSVQNSSVAPADTLQLKPMYGYFNFEKANDDPHAILDFVRLGDKEVTPNTPIIAPPQYTYDVFSISGEGTGGTIRAYRNDFGYVRDNYNKSKDNSWGGGIEVSPPGQFGGNYNIIETPTTIGEWQSQNMLRTLVPFKSANGLFENVLFKNPGENCVLNNSDFDLIGGTDLVRFKLAGSGGSPILTTKLQILPKDGNIPQIPQEIDLANLNNTERKKRTQVINFLSAKEASDIGLDRSIKNYNNTTVLEASNLKFNVIPRVSEYRKSNHISQINVTEADGKRYVYGIPVYNKVQKDFTFSVGGSATVDQNNLVSYNSADKTSSSPYLDKSSSNNVDGYLQITETPAYAHSFLLSGLLSPDYVDVTGDGITEDDLGNAVKFNYTKIDELYKWRSPHTSVNLATFNNGSRTNQKDNKGMITYGERESWYTHSIESKTMVAIFTLGARKDGKSAMSENGGVDATSNALRKLEKIDLYSKADLKANGLGVNGAKPIKTVHFVYSYSLCKGTPDNVETIANDKGKLTLEKIYFTFNGQEGKVSKNQYVFGYENLKKKRELGTSYNNQIDNPDYSYNSSDRWGNYKPQTANPTSMLNMDYPYSLQDKSQKSTIDDYASAWCLKTILLPSGGQIEVNYETDEYTYVQNKRAAQMVKIAGFGTHSKNLTGVDIFSGVNNHLYEVSGLGITENNCVFINVTEPCATPEDVNQKYLRIKPNEVNQLAFKLMVGMPKGNEYLTSYAIIKDYGVMQGNANQIWVELAKVDGVSPLALTAIEYLREQLPGQAFKGYDVSGETSLQQIIDMFSGCLSGLLASASNPINYIRVMIPNSAQFVDLNQSFVRLSVPDATPSNLATDPIKISSKYGGGRRVKSVILRDNWNKMTEQFTSSYGQEYDYTTTEIINGKEIKISSGVASYEPSIGGDENPFQTMYQVANKIPLGPTSYGSIEMPVLDAFFQAPVVGYSKVTVRSLRRYNPNDVTRLKSHSGIGKQVTEFYTAKDFPVKYYNTSFDPTSRLEAHNNQNTSFWHKSAFDAKALSQGFLVELNDMHGKMKSQASYPENDETTPINYTENFYRNTGKNGLNEKFDFVNNATGGTIEKGNMGIDVELMTDTRELSTKSTSYEVQAQVCIITVPIPLFFPFVWPVSGESENTYRSVTTTKVVNYHSIIDSVVVIDKGSTVSTKNLVYDAETGQVVVNRTQNEFNDFIYNTTYPAYWAYSGMGLAYKNIDAVYSGVNFYNGRIINGNPSNIKEVFESGDELYLMNSGVEPANTCNNDKRLASQNAIRLWAFDINKNNSSLTNSQLVNNELLFITEDGFPYSKDEVSFRIVRSGKRNMLGAIAQSISSLKSPIQNNKLDFLNNEKVVTASAIEYKEKWKIEKGIIKYVMPIATIACNIEENFYCDSSNSLTTLETHINPYTKGLLGTFRSWQNKILYSSRVENNPTNPEKTNISLNGFINNFSPYWGFNSQNNLVNDPVNNKWVYNSQITKINSVGQEIETKNALDIYTSALYGYKKNMPMAIVNNSRLNEMIFDGFEDAKFNANITNSDSLCRTKNWNLNESRPNTIVNAQLLGFTAHTGQNVLSIESQNEIVVDIVNSNVVNNNNFNLLPGPLTLFPNYNDTGFNVNIDSLIYCPDTTSNYPNSGTITHNSTNSSFTIQPPGISNNCPIPTNLNYNVSGSSSFNNVLANGYFIINTQGNYNVNVNTHVAGYNSNCTGLSIVLDLKVENELGQIMFHNPNDINEYCLKPGIYKLSFRADGMSFDPAPNQSHQCNVSTNNIAYPHTFTPTIAVYKTLSNSNANCSIPINFLKPIKAEPSMIYSNFSPSNNSGKMLFSAWVRENSIGVDPNGKPSYINSNLTIDFGNSSASIVLTPKGNIIDGWQRIEGDFLIPSNATSMSLKLNNLSSTPNYWDDIRIHPYNANMKSYVYDPITLRLVAELDENNYAKFYEYDEEGTLIRTKAETKEGIKTITETRSAKQKIIETIIEN